MKKNREPVVSDSVCVFLSNSTFSATILVCPRLLSLLRSPNFHWILFVWRRLCFSQDDFQNDWNMFVRRGKVVVKGKEKKKKTSQVKWRAQLWRKRVTTKVEMMMKKTLHRRRTAPVCAWACLPAWRQVEDEEEEHSSCPPHLQHLHQLHLQQHWKGCTALPHTDWRGFIRSRGTATASNTTERYWIHRVEKREKERGSIWLHCTMCDSSNTNQYSQSPSSFPSSSSKVVKGKGKGWITERRED